MKHYPSIVRINDSGLNCCYYSFDKLDGSNLRIQYSRKQGWYKWGTRNRLFDANDPMFGEAMPIFMATLAEPLAKIICDNRWNDAVVFAEFYGEKSFAGSHIVGDKKFLTLFDVSVHKKGLLGPKEFLKHFENLNIPKFLGIQKWNKTFIDSVKNSILDGISFEGVVGKSGDGHELFMVKCKTQKWLDEIKSRYSEDEATKLINS